MGRLYIHDSRPRAKKFLDRSASLDLAPVSWVAARVSDVIGTSYTVNPDSVPSVRGFVSYPARARFPSTKASALTMSVLPAATSSMLARNAAGFIATRTLGE